MAGRRKDLAARLAEAAQSAARAAGYCGLEHATSRASCTRSPHEDRRHADYYNGRRSVTDASGTEWIE